MSEVVKGWINNPTRRAFLRWAAAFTAAIMLPKESVADTLDRERWIPQWFIDAINQHEKNDSIITGNPVKYRELALPLIEDGLDKAQNLKMLRYLIYRELKHWYNQGASTAFRPYNAEEVWNDDKFFWKFAEGRKAKISALSWIISDYRIDGEIDFDGPEWILTTVSERLPEKESGNIAFIMKDMHDNMNIFIYYENGKLKYVLPTTPGRTGSRTPDNLVVTADVRFVHSFYDDKFKQWKHETKEEVERRREIAVRNGNTIGGAMPYSHKLHFQTESWNWEYGGHNTHIGNVTENGGSHGCARQTVLWAYLTFYGLKPWTLIYYRPDLRLKKKSN